jgi:long-chain acyl-CoA synthetase
VGKSFELILRGSSADNKTGEILVRGRGMLDAYYRPWMTREEIAAHGWFATGDLGYLDQDGYLYINGRLKDVINVGGMKFFPQEVEAVLETHPRIREAIVLPMEHKHLGETSYVEVVLASSPESPPSEEELKSYCSEHLASYKVPERIEFVAELRRGASGKLLRRKA